MIIVTVKTVTVGLKGKKALSSHGIKAKIVKIDGSEADKGCQYGIEFRDSDFYSAVSILRENGIEYGVYKAK